MSLDNREFNLSPEKEGGKLSEMEANNVRFSAEVKKKLREVLPGASDLPVVYIGSGGDGLSAVLSSGSDKVIMADDHPFMGIEGSQKSNSPLFQDVEELFGVAKQSNMRIGVLTLWSSVLPGVQLIANLEKIGIFPDKIKVQTNGYDADVLVDLGGAKLEFNYRCRRVNTIDELQQLLTDTGAEGRYGIMAKGGAGDVVQALLEESLASNSDAKPVYLITDDPRHIASEAITTEQEALMYPDYNLTEVVSSYNSGWGYSWDEVPNSQYKYDDDGHDYRARAVVGVLKQ